MRYLLVAGLAFVVSSCASNDGPSFATMSEMEILAYNRELPPEKHVFCIEDADTSTYIRRRVCRSFEDWVAHNERSAMTLDVLTSSPSFGLSRGIGDGPAPN